MYPSTEDVRKNQMVRAEEQLGVISQRLDDIKSRIHRVQHQQQHDKQQQQLAVASNSIQQHAQIWDWTKSYQSWSQYEDLDELQSTKVQEEAKMDALLEKQQIMQHAHDHSKEKEFFELPEETKIQMCEENRQVGNYLFEQGAYQRAAERYQIAIAYYEYCFPEDDDIQQTLDDLRHACLCNVALCYIRMAWYRQAVEAASQVIKESHESHAKAFYRRGQAYRYLDEYENSLRDLNKSLQLTPNDAKVLEEISVVQHLMDGYRKKLTTFSHTVLEKADYHIQHHGQDEELKPLEPTLSTDSVKYERKIAIFNEFLPIEPILPQVWQEFNASLAGATLR